MVSHHLVLEFCHLAQQVVRVEKGSGLTPTHSRTRLADIHCIGLTEEGMQPLM